MKDVIVLTMMVCCMRVGRSREHYTGKPFDKILIGMQSMMDAT